MTCACVDVQIGSYGNQVGLVPPAEFLRYNTPEREFRTIVDVDACLADEVKSLWAAGVRTTGCCCGHNKLPPYIGVEFADIPTMKRLGYEVQHNPSRPGDEDSFQPKSVPA